LSAAQHQVGSEPVATVVKLSRILFLPLIVYASVAPLLGKPAGHDGAGACASLRGLSGLPTMVLIQNTGVVPPMAVIITGSIVNFLLAVPHSAVPAAISLVRSLSTPSRSSIQLVTK
jgi:hypothetical protein